ncbi:hypothetical protein P4O66_009142 [Electrophorus voltai]|uniref:Uncharacterized protein n=1 Tax=Electrophorus voltai TaxID=2609070 RepID=A0AAD8ZB54_9TELE|nr:hypothetical protein P4O66_009142 [Electrophorus voltai]
MVSDFIGVTLFTNTRWNPNMLISGVSYLTNRSGEGLDMFASGKESGCGHAEGIGSSLQHFTCASAEGAGLGDRGPAVGRRTFFRHLERVGTLRCYWELRQVQLDSLEQDMLGPVHHLAKFHLSDTRHTDKQLCCCLWRGGANGVQSCHAFLICGLVTPLVSTTRAPESGRGVRKSQTDRVKKESERNKDHN